MMQNEPFYFMDRGVFKAIADSVGIYITPKKLFWMPDRVRHDGHILSAFLNYHTASGACPCGCRGRKDFLFDAELRLRKPFITYENVSAAQTLILRPHRRLRDVRQLPRAWRTRPLQQPASPARPARRHSFQRGRPAFPAF